MISYCWLTKQRSIPLITRAKRRRHSNEYWIYRLDRRRTCWTINHALTLMMMIVYERRGAYHLIITDEEAEACNGAGRGISRQLTGGRSRCRRRPQGTRQELWRWR